MSKWVNYGLIILTLCARCSFTLGFMHSLKYSVNIYKSPSFKLMPTFDYSSLQIKEDKLVH